MASKLAYDLEKPYRLIIGQKGGVIIQDSVAYEVGSGRKIGPVKQNLVLDPEHKDAIVMCQYSGATFPNTPEGKASMEDYQVRHGYVEKPKDGKIRHKESTLEERQAVVDARMEKLNKGKADLKDVPK